ncbi:MAG: LamG domain-containing protein [Phycisphaerae bacterium]|nr:LamG domain-containing protein [Phycisphaerae bacterium]
MITLLIAGNPAGASLVGYWAFDEGSGSSASDSSGQGNDGTVHGASWAVGQQGNALSFLGYDYVEIPDDPSMRMVNAVAISACLRRADPPDGRYLPILAKATGPNGTCNYDFYLNCDTGELEFNFWTGGWHSFHSTAKITDMEWHLVSVSYDREFVRFWVDQAFDSETQETVPMVPSSEEKGYVHWLPASGPPFASGTIDEVRLYDTPEPVTLALLGFGGLVLIRRNCK